MCFNVLGVFNEKAEKIWDVEKVMRNIQGLWASTYMYFTQVKVEQMSFDTQAWIHGLTLGQRIDWHTICLLEALL